MLQILNLSSGNKYKIFVMFIFYLLPPDEFKIYNMTESRTWTFKKKSLLFSIQFCLNENMVEFSVREAFVNCRKRTILMRYGDLF